MYLLPRILFVLLSYGHRHFPKDYQPPTSTKNSYFLQCQPCFAFVSKMLEHLSVNKQAVLANLVPVIRSPCGLITDCVVPGIIMVLLERGQVWSFQAWV